MIVKRLLLAAAILACAAPGAFAQSQADISRRGHAHESGALATNEERCTELMRQFDVASRDAGDQASVADAIALGKEGGSMCQYRDFGDGIAKLDQALAMLGQKPYGSAE